MHYSTSLAALTALAALSAASPNGWSSTKSADDGPNKLDECGCWPIYQTMLRCQKLKGPNAGTYDCACIPNPDGWYPSMNGCRDCLSPGSYDADDFFDNLSLTITQMFVSCTNAGGNVYSDGESICASNAYHTACTALKTDGQPSWASYEEFGDDGMTGNGTYVLDIAEYEEGASESSTARTATTATTTATATTSDTTATDSDSTTTTGTSVTTAAGTETTSGPAMTTTAPSSAMGYAGSRSRAEVVLGLAIAVGLGAILL